MRTLISLVASLVVAGPAFANDNITIEDEVNVVNEAFQLEVKDAGRHPDPRKA